MQFNESFYQLSYILYSQESNIPPLTHTVVCRQSKWVSARSNRNIRLTTRFVTVESHFFRSGKSLAALALFGKLTSVVPLRTPQIFC